MTTWKRTKPKWPASLGLLFVMALGMLLLSEVQVKAAATKVLYIVDSSGTNNTVTADDSGAGWSYAADTATLTLDGFDGSYIESDGDLKVVLKGTNRLTPDNDKNCVIKHLKRALHLRGEIHMTWRIKKCDVSHPRLLRKNRDTTLPFLRIIVQICILMVDTSDALDLATRRKHRL